MKGTYGRGDIAFTFKHDLQIQMVYYTVDYLFVLSRLIHCPDGTCPHRSLSANIYSSDYFFHEVLYFFYIIFTASNQEPDWISISYKFTVYRHSSLAQFTTHICINLLFFFIYFYVSMITLTTHTHTRRTNFCKN